MSSKNKPPVHAVPDGPPAIVRAAVTTVVLTRVSWVVLAQYLNHAKTDDFQLARRRFELARFLGADDFAHAWRRPLIAPNDHDGQPAFIAARAETITYEVPADLCTCLLETVEAAIKTVAGIDQFPLFELLDQIKATQRG